MKSIFIIHVALICLLLLQSGSSNAATYTTEDSPSLLFEVCYKQTNLCQYSEIHSKKGFFSSFKEEPFFKLDSTSTCAMFDSDYSCGSYRWSGFGLVAMIERQNENFFFVKMSQGANIKHELDKKSATIRQTSAFFLSLNQKNILFEDDIFHFGVTLI